MTQPARQSGKPTHDHKQQNTDGSGSIGLSASFRPPIALSPPSTSSALAVDFSLASPIAWPTAVYGAHDLLGLIPQPCPYP